VWKRECHAFCGNADALTADNACDVCDYSNEGGKEAKEKCGSICENGKAATDRADDFAEDSSNGKIRAIVEHAKRLLASGESLEDVIALVRAKLGDADMSADEVAAAVAAFIELAKKDVAATKELIKMCGIGDDARHLRGRRQATADKEAATTADEKEPATAEGPEKTRPAVVGTAATDEEVKEQKTRPEVTRAEASKCSLDELSEFTLTLENNEKILVSAEEFAVAVAAASSLGEANLDDLINQFSDSSAASFGSAVAVVVAALAATFA
jgi:hypothetical protein